MLTTLRDPRVFFNTNVPSEVQAETVRILFRAYRDAKTELLGADYSAAQYHDLYGDIRRSRIEDYLLKLPDKFSYLIASSKLNVVRNCYHSLVVCGNVILTASAVNNQTDLPRKAEFRNLYAGPQYEFEIDDANMLKVIDDIPDMENKLYAIIVHGPISIKERSEPGFARIVFPDKNCQRSLDHIDLFLTYDQVIKEILSEGTEIIPDEAEVKLLVNKETQRRLL